jgi:predicted ATPase
MGVQLKRLRLKGYKTIRDLGEEGLEFRPLNVLIGANGSGKSNLISFFRMLSWMVGNTTGKLQEYVGRFGPASLLLHSGPDVTRDISATLTLTTDRGDNDYDFRLAYASGDRLIFTEEQFRFQPLGKPQRQPVPLGSGNTEPMLLTMAARKDRTDDVQAADAVLKMLRLVKVFQFHHTGETSKIRGKWGIDDSRYLREDGGNLAPFLARLQREETQAYARIIGVLHAILPFFDDFVFEEEYGQLLLRWRERENPLTMHAGLAADGMLRAMALAALLLQPPAGLPRVIILDEPELGLHPYAISVLGGMVRKAATHTQVILATQSVVLLDEFDPADVIVVDRVGSQSTFNRVDATQLAAWLDDYSLSELWEKNVLGGRPQ